MVDILQRLAWLFFLVVAFAYVIFLILGSSINGHAIDTSRIVIVRDILQPGIHHLNGMVMVSRTCAELSVQNEDISSSTQKLSFRTWEDPSIPCVADDSPRSFHATVFAPAAGVHFIATLDGSPLTLLVQQQLQKP